MDVSLPLIKESKISNNRITSHPLIKIFSRLSMIKFWD